MKLRRVAQPFERTAAGHCVQAMEKLLTVPRRACASGHVTSRTLPGGCRLYRIEPTYWQSRGHA